MDNLITRVEYGITLIGGGGPPADDPYWERQNARYRAQGIPVRADYPDTDTYLRAWHWWRALQRESRLTPAEADAKTSALAWALGLIPKDNTVRPIESINGHVHTAGHTVISLPESLTCDQPEDDHV